MKFHYGSNTASSCLSLSNTGIYKNVPQCLVLWLLLNKFYFKIILDLEIFQKHNRELPFYFLHRLISFLFFLWGARDWSQWFEHGRKQLYYWVVHWTLHFDFQQWRQLNLRPCACYTSTILVGRLLLIYG